MPIEFILMILVATILCIVSYLAADTIYKFHYKLKLEGNPLSKVVTGDREKLESRDVWVRRYRAKLLILLVIIIVSPLVGFFTL